MTVRFSGRTLLHGVILGDVNRPLTLRYAILQPGASFAASCLSYATRCATVPTLAVWLCSLRNTHLAFRLYLVAW